MSIFQPSQARASTPTRVIELQSTVNGARVQVNDGSNTHKHLRQHANGATWQPVTQNTRSASVSVGVDFVDGRIVRDGDADVSRPRYEQGVQATEDAAPAKRRGRKPVSDAVVV
jgi:hypothetical protein